MSSEQVDIKAAPIAKVQITGLQNVFLSEKGESAPVKDICVYASSSYALLEFESGNEDKFALTANGSARSIEYEIKVTNFSGLYPIESTTINSNNRSINWLANQTENCKPGINNFKTQFEIIVKNANQLSTLPSGIYFDTVTVTISPSTTGPWS